MKRKILSILFTLVLALSLSLVTAVPAAAVAADALPKAVFGTANDGTAVWSQEEVDAAAGDYSVALTLPVTAGSYAIAQIFLPSGTTLADLEDMSYKYFVDTEGSTLANVGGIDVKGVGTQFDPVYQAPHLSIQFSVGEVPGGIVQHEVAVLTGDVWATDTIEATEMWHGTFDPDNHTFAEFIALYPNVAVPSVCLNLSKNGVPEVADTVVALSYVDTITIGEVVYDLEPRVINISTDEGFNTIQDAIDDEETLDEHTINVAAGTYAESVVVDKALTLQGADRDTCIVSIAVDHTNAFTITHNDVSISGLTVKGSNPGGGPSFPWIAQGIGVHCDGYDRCIIDDCIIKDWGGHGVYILTSVDSQVKNSLFDNILLNSIDFEDTTDPIINDNTITNVPMVDSSNIRVAGEGTRGTISRNVMNSGRMGIRNFNPGAIISYNTLSGIGTGGSIGVHGPDCIVEYNTLSAAASGCGIVVTQGGANGFGPVPCDNCIVRHNTVSGFLDDAPHGTAIGVRGVADGVIVEENTCTNNTAGIVVYGDSSSGPIPVTNCIVRNNIVSESLGAFPGGNAIMVNGVADGTIVEGNTCTNSRNGITLFDRVSNVIVRNNTIDTATTGMWIENGITNADVYGNEITGCSLGIGIDEDVPGWGTSENITINYNNIYGNGFGIKADYQELPEPTDATNNWWGDVAGPETDSEGTMHNPYENFTGGNAVSDYVDYLPWLIKIDLVTDFDGWNIVSFPIMGEGGDSEPPPEAIGFYWFDSFAQQWDQDPYEAGPLDAMYVKLAEDAEPMSFYYPVSSGVSFPSQKVMKKGWNFVGLAELHRMPAPMALASAFCGTGEANLWGYSQVISPSLNGASWTYMRKAVPPAEPQMFMLPTKGYWVFMVNDGVLGGFSSTPIVEVKDPLPPPPKG